VFYNRGSPPTKREWRKDSFYAKIIQERYQNAADRTRASSVKTCEGRALLSALGHERTFHDV